MLQHKRGPTSCLSCTAPKRARSRLAAHTSTIAIIIVESSLTTGFNRQGCPRSATRPLRLPRSSRSER